MPLDELPKVEQASRLDVAPLLRLRGELETWLHSRGIDQWQPGELTEQDIADQVARREWHVVRDADLGLIAAVRLLREDSEFWGDDPTPAVYVHGLMVSLQMAGQDLGTSLLEWACEQGRFDRAQVARLDCGESNTQLRVYYRANGFDEVGYRAFDRFTVVLFEKQLKPNGAHTAQAVRRHSGGHDR